MKNGAHKYPVLGGFILGVMFSCLVGIVINVVGIIDLLVKMTLAGWRP